MASGSSALPRSLLKVVGWILGFPFAVLSVRTLIDYNAYMCGLPDLSSGSSLLLVCPSHTQTGKKSVGDWYLVLFG
jgi:hypothetical protein